MFSAGCKLACIALSRGKIVAKVNMYGVVATMKDQCGSKILHLEIDFISSECHFAIVINEFDLTKALNIVLLKLQH